MNKPVAVVLAAGKSTRMKSDTPKVIHQIFGRSMIDYVLDTARAVGVGRMVVVVGHQADRVKAAPRSCGCGVCPPSRATRNRARGDGVPRSTRRPRRSGVRSRGRHAAAPGGIARKGMLKEQTEHKAGCVIGTAVTEANQGLGRIVRNTAGEFEAIVEQKDATPEQQAIQEINTGCYVFDCQPLLSVLTRLGTNNTQKEYYLTDGPALMKSDGLPVRASQKFEYLEAMGVNTRVQLAEVRKALQQRAMEHWMLEVGVTIVDPEQTSIDPRATIGQDTIIHPFTTIEGEVQIWTAAKSVRTFSSGVPSNSPMKPARNRSNCLMASISRQ